MKKVCYETNFTAVSYLRKRKIIKIIEKAGGVCKSIQLSYIIIYDIITMYNHIKNPGLGNIKLISE